MTKTATTTTKAGPRRNVGEVIKRGARWSIRYYDSRGRRRLESSGSTNREDAEKLLRRRLSAKDHGVQPEAAAGRLTVKEALDDVLNHMRMNGLRSRPNVEANINSYLLPWFGERRKMTTITTATIRQYTTERLGAGYMPATINRELAILRRAFNLAVRAGRLMTKPHVEMLRENNTRKGFLDPHAHAAIVKSLPGYAAAPIQFAYITGWRLRSEVLTLTWNQVDFAGRQVQLDPGTTKNREGRAFPFTGALEELMLAQKAQYESMKGAGKLCPWVFPFRQDGHPRDGEKQQSLRKVWMSACKAAGFPGMVIHDMRRSAVRTFERAGVPRSVAMSLIGHKTESIYRRYAIVPGSVSKQQEESEFRSYVCGCQWQPMSDHSLQASSSA